MARLRFRRLFFLFVPILLLLLIGTPSYAEPGDDLGAIWRRIGEIESYRFTADVEQTLIPLPVPENIGQQEERYDLHMEGAIEAPQRSRIDIWAESEVASSPPSSIIVDGDAFYLLQHGEKTSLIDPSQAYGPTSDFVGYLAAAENVRLAPSKFVAGQELTVYLFDIDGGRLAAYTREKIEAALQAQGKLESGQRLANPAVIEKMNGSGELWVGQDGLPRRQLLNLEVPEATEQFDAHLNIIVDFRDFGEVVMVPPVEVAGEETAVDTPTATADSAGGETAVPASSPLSLPDNFLPSVLMLTLALAGILAIVWLYRRNPKRAYTLIAVTLVIANLSPSLVQAANQTSNGASEKTAESSSDPLTDALLPDVDETISDLLGSQEPPAPTLQQLNNNPNLIENCGDGSLNEDTDQDGINDLWEGCLGTNPYEADTDFDGLEDLVELEGFQLNGQTFTTNPLEPDSNKDSLVDFLEWASPVGNAENQDIDQDGQPNVWDEDNDNDGVLDTLDLAPFAVSGYFNDSFRLSTSADPDDGYQYIELHIQPQDTSHLRYTMTALDWPSDDKGQITDLNDGYFDEDVRLSPILEVFTNIAPDDFLAAKYGIGITPFQNGEYRLLVPLYPVSSGSSMNGPDNIQAFYGKVVYDLTLGPSINWKEGRLLWMAEGQIDSYVANGTTATRSSLLNVYDDPFRLTGVRITNNKSFELARFGTPEMPTEDGQLFKLLFGLSGTFLENEQMENQAPGRTTLNEIELRFATPPTIPAVPTFGVTTTVAIDRQVFGHPDEALANAATELPNFLDANYPGQNYPPGQGCLTASGTSIKCAAIVSAFEANSSSVDLSGLTQNNNNWFSFDLKNLPNMTTRHLSLAMYEDNGTTWSVMTPARMIEIVEARYASQYDQIAADYQDQFPGLSSFELRFFFYLPYISWQTGRSKLISIDDTLLVFAVADETAIVKNALGLTDITQRQFPGLIIGQFQAYLDFVISTVGSVVKENPVILLYLNESEAYKFIYQKAFDKFSEDLSLRLNLAIAVIQGVYGGAVLATNLAVTVANIVCSSGVECNERALEVTNYVAQELTAISYVADIGFTVYNIINVSRAIYTGAASFSYLTAGFAFIGGVLAVLAYVISLAITWTEFGLVVSRNLDNPMIVNMAVARALVTTVYLTIILYLQIVALVLIVSVELAPLGLAIQIVILTLFTLDLIIGIASRGRYTLATAILGIYYETKQLTKVGTLGFLGLETGLEGSGSLEVGATFRVGDIFQGTIVKDQGDNSALLASYAVGALEGTYAGVTQRTPTDWFTSDCNLRNAPGVGGKELFCSNAVEIEFQLQTAAINDQIDIFELVKYYVLYAECVLWGFDCYNGRSLSDTLKTTKDPIEIFVDVLPNTVGGLWSWNALANPDIDGDGLPNDRDAAVNDWDLDNDGLSDGYEQARQADLGTDYLNTDTDQDGLPDGMEIRLGTLVSVADSDNDGLSDGDEIAGWDVQLPGGSFRVFSDPNLADADFDGLTDLVEKNNGTSPFAANNGPLIFLDGDPLASYLQRPEGYYIEPGDNIRIDIGILNTSSNPIAETAEACLPPSLVNLSGGQMNGDRTPDLVQGSCANGGTAYQWIFQSIDTLQVGDYVTTTITAQADPAITSSTVAVLSATLPYDTDKTAAQQLVVAIDADDPLVMLAAPQDGAYIRGQSYVVGGTSSDPTSWVTDVSLSINDGQTPPQVSGTGNWAATWSLPADGIYQLQAEATDFVDHTAVTDITQVIVDNTPPVVTSNLADRQVISDLGTDAILLSGTASDNLAGIERVQLSIANRPWREAVFDENSGTWQYDWQLNPAAQGEFEIVIRAFDRAGNISDFLVQTIILDRLPPTNTFTSQFGQPLDAPANLIPRLPGNDPIEITGWANDLGNAPLVSQPADLSGPLDLLDDATIWLSPHRIHDDDGGIFAAWLGDVDGDGLADLGVGLPASRGGDGRISILFGRGGNWPQPPDAEAIEFSPVSFVGLPGAGLGDLFAPAGDVNADGFSDFLIGDRSNERVFLILGSPSPGAPNVVLDSQMMTLVTEFDGLTNLNSIAPAGDINDDGFDDFFISYDGQAYLIAGSIGPWLPVADAAVLAWASGPLADGHLITGVGDVNDDQYDDFVMTADNVVHLLDGLNASIIHQLDPNQALHNFLSATTAPQVVALGQTNNDSYSDFIYGDGVAPKVVLGRASGPWNYSFEINKSPAANGFLAAVGDVDKDGFNDLLAGHANGDAYLFSGQSLPAGAPIAATFSNVAGAASTPYAAGADLNFDGSSDLLLIPDINSSLLFNERPELRLPEAEAVDTRGLAVAPAPPSLFPNGGGSSLGEAALAGTIHTVDDDGDCLGAVPCYTTVGAAITAATRGDEIIIRPGVYSPFTVNKNRLNIHGVDADAVTIDGNGTSFGVWINGVNGVTLSNLTIRNAADAVLLSSAGVQGYDIPARRTTLDRILAYDFTHAVTMDRVSTLNLSRNTFAGQGSSQSYINITGPADTSVLPGWTDLAGTLANNGSGALLFNNTHPIDPVFNLPNPASPNLYRFDQTTETWWQPSLGTPPGNFNAGSRATFLDPVQSSDSILFFLRSNGMGGVGCNSCGNEAVNSIVMNGDDIYVGGTFDVVNNPPGTTPASVPANNIARWNKSDNRWYALGSGANRTVRTLLIGGGYLYVGGDFSQVNGFINSQGVARLLLATNGWDSLTFVNNPTFNNNYNGFSGDINSGVSGNVHALAYDGITGQVYIGGDFVDTAVLNNVFDHSPFPFGVLSTCLPGPYEITLFNGTDYFEDPVGHGGGGGGPYCQKFGPGEYDDLDAYPIVGRNTASSVLLGRLVTVLLCDQTNFSGGCRHIQDHLNDIGTLSSIGTNDLASMKVFDSNFIPAHVPSYCRPGPYEIVLFNGTDYYEDPVGHGGGGGSAYCKKFGPGFYLNLDGNASSDGTIIGNNTASSVLLGAFVTAKVCDETGWTGGCFDAVNHITDLGVLPVDGDGGMGTNDLASILISKNDCNCSVSKWDGTLLEEERWSPLGNGANGPVYALAYDSRGIIIGGSFTETGREGPLIGNTHYLSQFNEGNNRWEYIGGFGSSSAIVNDGPVHSLTMREDNHLIVGGTFTSLTDWVGTYSGSYLAMLYLGQASPTVLWPRWSILTNAPLDGRVNTAYLDGSNLYIGGDFSGHLKVADRDAIWTAAGAWQTVHGGTNGNVNDIVIDQDFPFIEDFYVAGDFTQAGSSNYSAPGIFRWTPSYSLNTTYGDWFSFYPAENQILTSILPSARTASDGQGNIYVFAGAGSAEVERFRPLTNSWLAAPNLPVPLSANSAVTWVGKQGSEGLYLVSNGVLRRLNPISNSWQIVTSNLPAAPLADMALVWDGDDAIFANFGSPVSHYFQLSTSQWKASVNAPTVLSGAGAGLVAYNGFIYATLGGNSTGFGKYELKDLRPEKLDINDTLFVAPPGSAGESWLSLDSDNPPADFHITWGSNEFVGSSWTEGSNPIPITGISYEAAAFLNQPADVYRLRQSSTLDSGYYTYAPNTTVATDCSGLTACYTDIQSAIDTGAQQVHLLPGIYRQPFYLVSGMTLIGSIGSTAVSRVEASLSSSSGPMILGEGVRGVTVAHVAMNGDDRLDGIVLDAGSYRVDLSRLLIQNASTAVLLNGTADNVSLINSTLVNNDDGLLARNCLDTIDLRNTIFYGHQSRAVTSNANTCNGFLLNQYNLYWKNNQDWAGSAVVGIGEIVGDPFFTSPIIGNYRPLSGSPAIDAGDPGTPAPPGLGSRVDIGYIEQGQASVYVAQEYCETCPNNGLTWQLDAFDTIQDGLDAAETARLALNDALLAGGAPNYTVVVSPGTYLENLSVPAFVDLIGSGAEQTTIQANSGNVVNFNNGQNSQLKGFRIVGSGSTIGVRLTGASKNVVVTRNIISGHDAAILVAGESAVSASYNTILNNNSGIRIQVARSSVIASSNILYNNTIGLDALLRGTINNSYNLLDNRTNYAIGNGVIAGFGGTVGDLENVDPLFVDLVDYKLTTGSPAVDTADPLTPAIIGGGDRTDMGYREVVATPLALFFGEFGQTAAIGLSGIGTVEIGIGQALSPTQSLSETLPSNWNSAALFTPGATASYYTNSLNVNGEGFFRLFGRAIDLAGNVEQEESKWFGGQFFADGSGPTINISSYADGQAYTVAGLGLSAEAMDGASEITAVYFEVNGQPLDAHSVQYSPGSRGRQVRFRSQIPVSVNGPTLYTLTAIAVDSMGNEGRQEITITLNPAPDVATITSLDNNGALPPLAGPPAAQAGVVIGGFAHFNAPGGQVTVAVDGGAPIVATMEDPAATDTAWSAMVPLPPDGIHSIVAAANSTASPPLTVIQDSGLPQLTVTSPAEGAIVQEEVTFLGTASDSGSGLAAVLASFDNGTTWMSATLTANTWSLLWTSEPGAATLTYKALFRAIDKAGNVTEIEHSVSVDNDPPSGIEPVSFNIPEGTHLDIASTLEISWTAAVDNSGQPLTLIAVDQITNTSPVSQTTGTIGSAVLDANGEWYVHLRAEDSSGNFIEHPYGPWYVGLSQLPSCAARQQSILVDGAINLKYNEWLAAQEFMDNDERGFDPQSFYVTWGAEGLYAGWQGAAWDSAGSLWLYAADGGSGTTQPVEPIPGGQLPFAAEFAVQIRGEGDGTLWVYNGTWQEQPGLTFAHTLAGGTELLLPLNTVGGSLKLLAFAADDAGQPWSVFPTTNSLTGPWTSAYQWPDPCNTPVVNAGQPVASTVDMSVSSLQPGSEFQGPGDELTFVVDLLNGELAALSGQQLQIEVEPALALTAVTGAVCNSCPAGGSTWLLDLPTLISTTNHTVTITGQLAADLTAVTGISTTFTLPSATSPAEIYYHQTDGAPPEVTVGIASGKVTNFGPQTLIGTADDNEQSGVEQVEYRRFGTSTWLTAEGTLFWSAPYTVTSPDEVIFEVRATDQVGNVSSVEKIILVVDVIPPQITFTVPDVISSTAIYLSGTALDPAPAEARVEKVEVFPEVDGYWQAGSVYEPQESGMQFWNYGWLVPQADNVPYRLRARATDFAGNVIMSEWMTTTVDNVAPVITVTTYISSILLGNYPGGPLVLAGETADNAGISEVRIRVYTPVGTVVYDPVPVDPVDGSWSYVPPFSPPYTGKYILRVESIDTYGNLNVAGPFNLWAADTPIQNLQAFNDSPTVLGQTTTVSATIDAGSTVNYVWLFGDGANGSGMTDTHIYPAVGTYTAVVIASNSEGTRTATTEVTIIDETISGLTATNDSPTTLGQATNLQASVVQGSNVSFVWNFGDGSQGSGASVNHLYLDPGIYTATVTATNSISAMMTETVVTVEEAVSWRVFFPFFVKGSHSCQLCYPFGGS